MKRPRSRRQPPILEAVKQRQEHQAREDEVARLRNLCAANPLAYETERRAAAERLDIRVSVLDRIVKAAAPAPAAGKTATTWPPPLAIAAEPVEGQALLVELISAIRRFVMLDASAALIAALWILFTWTFERIAETNPYLRIVSPTPECGKSTLLKVLRFLCRGGWLISRLSPSSFTRTLGKERRTLLLDEGDAFLNDNENMRNLLDGASDPDTATVSFSVKSGEDWNPVELNCFVPIAIASIGTLHGMQTVESRAIAIHSKRATPAELKMLAKGRRRELKATLEPLAAKCARWAQDNAEALKDTRPAMPDSLSGREQDKWEPLIAIADAAGGEWPERARAAALALARSESSDSLSITLLRDIKSVLAADPDRERWGSTELCEQLVAIETSPWASVARGKPITGARLARMLRPFGVYVRQDAAGSYYRAADFTDCFSRYLPDPPFQSATVPQVAGGVTENEISKCHSKNGDGTLKSATTPTGSAADGTMALSDPPIGDGEDLEL
jgi:putative DNA primase/helicase